MVAWINGAESLYSSTILGYVDVQVYEYEITLHTQTYDVYREAVYYDDSVLFYTMRALSVSRGCCHVDVVT